jgi:hypothetical protein
LEPLKLFSTLIHKGEDIIKDFLHKSIQEIDETKEAGLIIKKYAQGGKLSKEEKHAVKVQFYDICKTIGIGIPFALIPGASLILPFLVKIADKHGIHLLPTSFSDDADNKELPAPKEKNKNSKKSKADTK